MLRDMERNLAGSGGREGALTSPASPNPEDIAGRVRDEVRNSGQVCHGKEQPRGIDNELGPAGEPSKLVGWSGISLSLALGRSLALGAWHPSPSTVRVGSPQESTEGRR